MSTTGLHADVGDEYRDSAYAYVSARHAYVHACETLSLPREKDAGVDDVHRDHVDEYELRVGGNVRGNDAHADAAQRPTQS